MKKNMEINIKKENLESSGKEGPEPVRLFHFNFLDKGGEPHPRIIKRENKDLGRCANSITGRGPDLT